MAYTDYLERDVKVSYTGAFDLNELYKEINRWAKQHQYKPEEKEYDITDTGEGQAIKIKLDTGKKVSDYAKIGIFVALISPELKDKVVKNKKLKEGKIEVILTTYIKRDYDDVWSRKNFLRFLREFYDKFIGNSRFDVDEKQLHDDMVKLKNAVKDFLKAPILKK